MSTFWNRLISVLNFFPCQKLQCKPVEPIRKGGQWQASELKMCKCCMDGFWKEDKEALFKTWDQTPFQWIKRNLILITDHLRWINTIGSQPPPPPHLGKITIFGVFTLHQTRFEVQLGFKHSILHLCFHPSCYPCLSHPHPGLLNHSSLYPCPPHLITLQSVEQASQLEPTD